MPSYGERYRSAVDPLVVEEIGRLKTLPFAKAMAWYESVVPELSDAELRYLGAADRFFLMVGLMGRTDMKHPWVYDRCREVERDPDGYIDLWARYHYKSSIGTTGGIVQELINDPDLSICILSNGKSLAESFLSDIKEVLETSDQIKSIYPDVFWAEPEKQAPRWGVKVGLVIKRSGNRKEASVEAHGLLNAMPTGKHFPLIRYDDIVIPESVTTPEVIAKTTRRFELSHALGVGEGTRKQMAGTRYSFADTYSHILDKRLFVPRIYPATADGKEDGEPVLMSRPALIETRGKMGREFSAQMLLNPAAGTESFFRAEWLTGYEVRPPRLNVAIMVDPSKGIRATSDRTAIAVVGIDGGGTKYLLDGYRHRMSLSERWLAIKALWMKWSQAPGVGVVRVGYERYGQNSDDEYIKERQEREGISFELVELAWPREGGSSKKDRVGRLEPDLKAGRFRIPAVVWNPDAWNIDARTDDHAALWTYDQEHSLFLHRPLLKPTRAQQAMLDTGQGSRVVRPVKRLDENREPYDLTRAFIEELVPFPFSAKDDLVDAVSRIFDMDMRPPIHERAEDLEPPEWGDA
jgi:hypothetical protein